MLPISATVCGDRLKLFTINILPNAMSFEPLAKLERRSRGEWASLSPKPKLAWHAYDKGVFEIVLKN